MHSVGRKEGGRREEALRYFAASAVVACAQILPLQLRSRYYEKGPSARSRCVPSGGGAAGERIIFRENLSAAAPFAVCAALFLCVATPLSLAR